MYPVTSVSRQYLINSTMGQSKLGKRTNEQKAKDCQKYLLTLADYRLLWEPMIDNIIMYVNHGRRFVQNYNQWPGQQTGQEVFDDSAMLARNIATDGMVGNMCSRNMPWFALELPGKFNFPRTSGMRSWNGKRVDSYPVVMRWLQECQEVLYSAFNRSNFYDINTEFISDGLTSGTAHLLVEEDVVSSTTVFTVPHFRECYVAENQWGKIDTNYRVYKMTLRQLVQKFGMDRMLEVDSNFKQQYENNMYVEAEILHAIYPRADFQPGRADHYGKRWESVWLYCKGGKILDGKGSLAKETEQDFHIVGEGGYDSMPIITWRWRKNNDEVYGRSPAWDAFVSIAQANQMGRTNLITAHQAAEPPLVAYSDMRGAIQRGPSGITYVESNRGDIRARMPQPLFTGTNNLPFNVEYQDRVKAVINQHFHTDVFMMLSQISQQHGNGRPVVEQITEMQSEKAAILGTRVGNLQSEAFDPLIFRMFSIEAGAGRIPEPPDILTESVHGPVEVQYLGPLSQAQTRLTKVRSITTGLGLVQQIAAVNPTSIDVVDYDAMALEALDAVSFPASCYRDPRMVAEIRAQRAKQQQQEEVADQAPKLARAAASLSKSPEAGSIMQQLVGGEPAQ